MKNRALKSKVETITVGYMELFKDEYKLVCAQLEGEREKNKDKFASVAHDRTIQRKLYEIPETLHNMIISQVTKEELLLMKEGENGKDFARWFATRFPEFASSTHI